MLLNFFTPKCLEYIQIAIGEARSPIWSNSALTNAQVIYAKQIMRKWEI